MTVFRKNTLIFTMYIAQNNSEKIYPQKFNMTEIEFQVDTVEVMVRDLHKKKIIKVRILKPISPC